MCELNSIDGIAIISLPISCSDVKQIDASSIASIINPHFLKYSNINDFKYLQYQRMENGKSATCGRTYDFIYLPNDLSWLHFLFFAGFKIFSNSSL